jgi:hypothetical protein
MKPNFLPLALLALPMLMLTACSKPLAVRPATAPGTQSSDPGLRESLPPLVSWYPKQTCKPAPK